MRTQVNKEEMRREWIVETWYDKVYFAVGVFFTWSMIGAFLVGFIQGLIEL